MSIAVGACFSSCEELETAIADLEKQTSTNFWKRDAKTITSVMKKHSNLDKVKKELHYYSIKYTCVLGGRKHQKKCTDNSRQSKTFRQNCPAFIRILLSDDKQYLQVKAVNFEHDHPISQALYNAMPKVRRLDDGCKANVRKLMDLQVNKKLLQQNIVNETGKHMTLKDLSNIAAKGKKLDDFDEILNILQRDHKCSVLVLKDHTQMLQGLFFQDVEMKEMFSNYPEVLFFDGTYKLLNNNFTCYIFLVEDGNGSSEVIGVGLLAHENKDSVHWLISSFQGSNDEWRNTQVVVTDKDFTEHGVFTDLFPEVKLEICLFHTLKSFRREITPEKMKMSNDLCDSVKEYLTKLAYCPTEESYASVYEAFRKVAPASVLKYYDSNWHNIQEILGEMTADNLGVIYEVSSDEESIDPSDLRRVTGLVSLSEPEIGSESEREELEIPVKAEDETGYQKMASKDDKNSTDEEDEFFGKFNLRLQLVCFSCHLSFPIKKYREHALIHKGSPDECVWCNKHLDKSDMTEAHNKQCFKTMFYSMLPVELRSHDIKNDSLKAFFGEIGLRATNTFLVESILSNKYEFLERECLSVTDDLQKISRLQTALDDLKHKVMTKKTLLQELVLDTEEAAKSFLAKSEKIKRSLLFKEESAKKKK